MNKVDLLEDAGTEENEIYRNFLADYEKLGYPIISVSTETGTGIEALKNLLQQKTSVFSGQSGVGKSSLLNRCYGLTLKVGELTQKTTKGAHTTSMAELLPIPGGGYCVDTPGIRSFGIWSLKKDEVLHHFQDIAHFATNCKFPDCSHGEEPSCAVHKALEEGKISLIRYQSYQTLLNESQAGPDKTTWS